MGDLIYKDNKFIYTEQGEERSLLDCGDYLSNKSRISMHCLKDQNLYTIPELLAELMEEGPCREDDAFAAALIDVLLTDRLIRTSQPVRVLEYGCLGGRLSFYLAKLIGAFCEESSLVCACDRMDMEWMDQIANVKKLPHVSFLAGDYGELQLQKGYFDMILINGTVNFTDPCKVIADALQLASEDGTLLCYVDASPLLDGAFKLFFEKNKREDYEISLFTRLMCAKTKDRCWMPWEEEQNFERLAKEHLQKAEDLLMGGTKDGREQADMLKILIQDTKTAAAIGRVGLKLQLQEQKEKLMDCERRKTHERS